VEAAWFNQGRGEYALKTYTERKGTEERAVTGADERLFRTPQSKRPIPGWSDAVVLLGVVAFLYGGVRLAFGAPSAVAGPGISLSLKALPLYAGYSLGRMFVAYALSMIFSLGYGYLAASSKSLERVLLPVLDVLQSIPILSFLPVVLLGLSTLMADRTAAQIASILLIFTSQAWNLTFSWYQALTTLPEDLVEAGSIFRFNGWFRFKTLQLPFAALSLIWNSMMSWAGGWFFLMAAEIFTVGQRDFRLPGLGAYLQEAAAKGNISAVVWGVGVLVLLIVLLDQLIWRPLLAWADRFKLEMVQGGEPPTSWFYDLLRSARVVEWLSDNVWDPLWEKVDAELAERFPPRVGYAGEMEKPHRGFRILTVLLVLAALFGAYKGAGLLMQVSLLQLTSIPVALVATFLRVAAALAIALAWTLPLGVIIGTNRKMARWLQPLVQITASVPATALFPVFLLFAVSLPQGLNIAAVALMLMGTQWYLLFNIIAGSAAIPQDLEYTSTLLGLGTFQRWRTLVLPSLFPYIITGAITASGGAWNASIIAEYVSFGGKTLHVTGIGSLIAEATNRADYAMLFASTLAMILTVVLINRLVWRRLYRLAEEKYRME